MKIVDQAQGAKFAKLEEEIVHLKEFQESMADVSRLVFQVVKLE